MVPIEILLFIGIWAFTFIRVLKIVRRDFSEVIDANRYNTTKKYNSFDGSVRKFKNGEDYFVAIEYEKLKIIESNIYGRLIYEVSCIHPAYKEVALKNLNNWKLPGNIFMLTPEWWNVNDIQDESPAVTAFIQIVKNEISKI